MASVGYFLLGILCLGVYVFMQIHAEKIRNSKFWFPAFIASLFLIIYGVGFLEMSGVFKMMGGS